MTQNENILNDQSLDILFREARTYNGWQARDVSPVVLRALYDLLKWGPTSANCSPARIVFVQSKEAKEKLKPHMAAGNVEKTMAAPVTAIIAQDMDFYEEMPRLFPHTDAKSWFVGKPDYIRDTAFRNSTLQGAYLMMAARSLGLDCGPMSGFDKDGVKSAFFADKNWEANFVCNLGYGDPASLHPRLPRFAFDDVCQIL